MLCFRAGRLLYDLRNFLEPSWRGPQRISQPHPDIFQRALR